MTIRIPFPELVQTLARILAGRSFEARRAEACARLFAETTRDGVYSHGVNRFPRFLATVDSGVVDVHAEPECVAGAGDAPNGAALGCLERWNGRHGPGNLNAQASMARALTLARRYGAGCVALAHTNHWMRGGTYGWQAAEAGMIAICWTNTMPNLPAWGAKVPVLGNNPLVIAVPRADGHLVLDIAMSQFSYGALASYAGRGEMLPFAGGFDLDGNLTRDPKAIEQSQRALPIGYWKGSGLSLLLDVIAATLSGGLAAFQIPADVVREGDLSQVFLALNPGIFGPGIFGPAAGGPSIADLVVRALKESGAGDEVRYPGEQVLKIRAENMAQGIPVDESLWLELKTMG